MSGDVSGIVGITFMVIGGLLVSIGLILCYTTKVNKQIPNVISSFKVPDLLQKCRSRT